MSYQLHRFAFIFIHFLLPSSVFASIIDLRVADAIEMLVQEFEDEMDEMAVKVKRTAISSVKVPEGMGDDVRNLLLREIEAASATSSMQFVKCQYCFIPTAEQDGEYIYIRKGLTSKKEVIKMARTMGVKNYTEISLTIGEEESKLQVSTYRVPNSRLIWSRSFSTPIGGRASREFIFSLSSGFLMGEKTRSISGTVFIGENSVEQGEFGLAVYANKKMENFPAYFAFGPEVGVDPLGLFGESINFATVLITLHVGMGQFNKDNDIFIRGGLKINLGKRSFIVINSVQGRSPLGDTSAEAEVPKEDSEDEVSQKFFPGGNYLGFGINF